MSDKYKKIYGAKCYSPTINSSIRSDSGQIDMMPKDHIEVILDAFMSIEKRGLMVDSIVETKNGSIIFKSNSKLESYVERCKHCGRLTLIDNERVIYHDEECPVVVINKIHEI